MSNPQPSTPHPLRRRPLFWPLVLVGVGLMGAAGATAALRVAAVVGRLRSVQRAL